jgi:hypothetical protein
LLILQLISYKTINILFFILYSSLSILNAQTNIVKTKIINSNSIDRNQFLQTYSDVKNNNYGVLTVSIIDNKINIDIKSQVEVKTFKEISIKEIIKNEKYIISTINEELGNSTFTFYKKNGIYYYFIDFQYTKTYKTSGSTIKKDFNDSYEVRNLFIQEFVTLKSATRVNNAQTIIFIDSKGNEKYFCSLPEDNEYVINETNNDDLRTPYTEKFIWEKTENGETLRKELLNKKYEIWYKLRKYYNENTQSWNDCYEISNITYYVDPKQSSYYNTYH